MLPSGLFFLGEVPDMDHSIAMDFASRETIARIGQKCVKWLLTSGGREAFANQIAKEIGEDSELVWEVLQMLDLLGLANGRAFDVTVN